MLSAPIHENAQAVREFFDHWEVYRKFVVHNHLHHREAMAAFAAWLDARGSVGKFLDLGCGDSAFTSKILAPRDVTSYTGMDCSPVALQLAEKNLSSCPFPRNLICADFFSELPKMTDRFDTIFIGLSFHHLPAEDKTPFLRSAIARLNPSGGLAFFEPARLDGEAREEFLTRTSEHARSAYTGITPEELEGALAHIRSADFPESPATYCRMARDAGFARDEVLYISPDELFAVVACSGIDSRRKN